MRLLTLVLIFLFSFSPSTFAAGSPNTRFNQWLLRVMQEYQVPAVSIVVIRDFKIDWVGTFGVKNIFTEEPVSDTTLFQAGSLSKPLTAMAILISAQEGNINLDEGINTALTSWKLGSNVFTQQNNVTIEELLSHTAGINVSGYLGYSPGEKLPTLLEVLNGTPPANSPITLVEEEPGQHFLYSGGGYTIIQQLLIDLYHKPFSDIMDELVLEPLSMSNSTFDQPLPARFTDDIATPYRPGFNSIKGGPHTYVEQAAAGLWTTPFDLAKFTISLQESLRGNPYQLLKPTTAKLMVTPVQDHMALGLLVNMSKYGQPTKHGRYFMLTGQNEGYRSLLIGSMTEGYGAVIMTNMAPNGKLVMSGKYKDDGFLFAILAMIADMEQWR